MCLEISILLMVQKSSYPPVDMVDMDVSENSDTPKSSILIGFSIIFTIHFGVPLFLETPISTIKIYKVLAPFKRRLALGISGSPRMPPPTVSSRQNLWNV